MVNRIKELRKKSGLTQQELAKQLGISQQRLSLYEKGERTENTPTTRKVWKQIADFFNVPVSFLNSDLNKTKVLHFLADQYENNNSELHKKIIKSCNLRGIKEIPGNDYKFWKNNFSFVFNDFALKYIMTQPSLQKMPSIVLIRILGSYEWN